jgi:CheY-like chemotaxis protein
MELKKVLICLADDDEDDRLIFAEALSEVITHELTMIPVCDGNKLMDYLNNDEKLPDLIFLDLNMPNKNGKEALALIRSIPAFRSLPVIVYSTSTSETDISEVYRAGASMYVEKPYSVAHLVKVLNLVINRDWTVLKGRLPKDQFFISSKEDGDSNWPA